MRDDYFPPVTNVLAALAKVQAEIEKVVKVKRPGMQYKVVMYDDLLDTIRDAVLEAGLTLVPTDCLHVASTPYDRIGNNGAVHMNREVYVFTFRLYHVPSGEFLQLSTPGDGVDEMDKGPGKALTYATKTAWEKLLLLARGDAADPDGRPSQPRPAQQQTQQPPPKPAAPPASTITWDPKTWPVNYQEMYNRDIEGFETPEAIEKYKDWSWINSMEFFEKYTAERSFPADVRYFYVRGIVIKMLATALGSRHAVAVAQSLREPANQERLRKVVGDGTFNRILAKIKSEEEKASQPL